MSDTATGDAVGQLVIDLFEAAVRVEGKGQLNIGKWLRASATALALRAASRHGYPRDTGQLVSDLDWLSQRLRAGAVGTALSDRVALAAIVVRRGGFADLERFPDIHVCRRCGTLTTNMPTGSCASCGAHGLTFERFSTTYWSQEWQLHEVVDRLAGNPSLFRRALLRVAPARRTRAPTKTDWSAVDVLRHVRDANALFAERVKLILEHDDPRLEARATYARKGQDPTESADALLDAYASVREAAVARMRNLSADSWFRTGRHAAVGRVTLAEQASYFAAHELTHLRQLELLRRSTG